MIKIVFMDGDPAANDDAFLVLYADTKDEVPASGDGTVAELEGYGGEHLPAGSFLYTAAQETAVLNSSDEWVWKDDE